MGFTSSRTQRPRCNLQKKVYEIDLPNGTEWIATIGAANKSLGSFQDNYYVLSSDGLNFQSEASSATALGYASTPCTMSEPALGAGLNGHLYFGHGANVVGVFSAERALAPGDPDIPFADPGCIDWALPWYPGEHPRGSTWDVFYIQGTFSIP